MKDITRIDIHGDIVSIFYQDNQDDPKWLTERVVIANCKAGTPVQRLVHVGYHLFNLLIENPKAIETSSDEILLEWVGQLFSNPKGEHDIPKPEI